MQNARNALTPDSLAMLQGIADTGSFAAAARQLGLVPSALTYRVRRIEDALDVLLFDRSARQARPTPAGAELLREGARLLQEIDAVAHRVKRVATGWEPQLTIAVDGVISPHTLLDLVEAFYALAPPTRLKICTEILTGTLESLTSGRADLAIGVAVDASNVAGLQQGLLGETPFILVMAPHHPLASAPEPLTDATLVQHRQVAVADSAQTGNVTTGLLGGQDVLTVDSMQAKLQAQLVITLCIKLTPIHLALMAGDICLDVGNSVAAVLTDGIAQAGDLGQLASLFLFQPRQLGAFALQRIAQSLQTRVEQAQLQPGKVRSQGIARLPQGFNAGQHFCMLVAVSHHRG